MSRVVFDFLNDSFLLDRRAVKSQYKGFSEAALRSELTRYREHIASRIVEISAEVRSATTGPNAYAGATTGKPIDRPLLKRMALYFTKTVIDDPLARYTRVGGESEAVISEFFGYIPDGRVDRAGLAETAGLLAAVRPLVGIDCLKVLPVSMALEPPTGVVPIAYSPSLFRERVPEELRELFRSRASTTPLVKLDEGGWAMIPGTPLEPCRAIAIEFEGYPGMMTFHLTQMKADEDPNRPGVLNTTQWLPSDPPDVDTFEAWVAQSQNQFAGDVVRRSVADVVSAVAADAMLLTDSDLVAEALLVGTDAGSSVETEIASLSLELRLPTVDTASEQDLAVIRRDHGQAFEVLRIAVDRALRDVREERDPNRRSRLLDELRHELENTQVREARLVLERLKNGLKLDALLGFVGLAASIPTGGLSILGAVTAAAMGVAKVEKARQELGKNAGVFLWKLQERTAG